MRHGIMTQRSALGSAMGLAMAAASRAPGEQVNLIARQSGREIATKAARQHGKTSGKQIA